MPCRPTHTEPGATRLSRRAFCAALGAAGCCGAVHAEAATTGVPVLVYHRFARTAEDGMTVRLATFERHLQVLQDARCQVVPLADVVAWRRGESKALPPRAVALSADDAHRSQAEHMGPMLRGTGWPVTLFVYPSAVSNADYAMRWEQLAEMQATGLYRIESHTYWHPHLPRERRHLSPEAFEAFATDQLVRSRQRLQERLGAHPTLLAWPFGMTDEGLMALAGRVGYAASFSLGNRPVRRQDPLQALPRHLVTDAMDGPRLARLLDDAFAS
ncbi:polysaccharide deacetylase family protein [Ideonella sp. YS5]|uniref:polysaccharide deacetylase family protein n=1 Tax=Ideonella sp. YS5 TaxID=3453714 RepID=UPI003EEEC249